MMKLHEMIDNTAMNRQAGLRRRRRPGESSIPLRRCSWEKMMFLLVLITSSFSESSAFTQSAAHGHRPPSANGRMIDLQSSMMADFEREPLLEWPPRWSPFALKQQQKERKKEAKQTQEAVAATSVSTPTFKLQLPSRPSTAEEQERMNEMTLGAVVVVGVLYALAIEGDAPELELLDTVGAAATNILETALPSTTYEVVAIALGETIAGLTGALASLSLNLVLQNARGLLTKNQRQLQRAQTVINDAVAESDYFLARAAVLPILEGVGLPPGLATIASTVFATLPYELVKLGKRKRTAREEENEMLAEMLNQQLENEEMARQQERWNMEYMLKKLRQVRAEVPTNDKVVDTSSLRPVQTNEQYAIDGVEFFADTCKWLSYSVLMKDFSGTLHLASGIESGIYGLLATLSSQVYADFLYLTKAGGPQAKQDLVRSRPWQEWIQLYISKCISAFTLFGVYATVQAPVRIGVNALLSGSIDSCIGSSEMDVCMETYITQNPPGADAGAQLRAVATTLYSFTQLNAMDFGFQATPDAQIRAIIITLYSLMNRLVES